MAGEYISVFDVPFLLRVRLENDNEECIEKHKESDPESEAGSDPAKIVCIEVKDHNNYF